LRIPPAPRSAKQTMSESAYVIARERSDEEQPRLGPQAGRLPCFETNSDLTSNPSRASLRQANNVGIRIRHCEGAKRRRATQTWAASGPTALLRNELRSDFESLPRLAPPSKQCRNPHTSLRGSEATKSNPDLGRKRADCLASKRTPI